MKIVTTAEGGMAVTNDAGLAATMDRMRSHGITRDPALMTHESDGGWYYQQLELGFNYRMTELQAALGVSQMHRLDQFVTRRRELAARYFALLADLPVTLPQQSADTDSAWHLYILRLNDCSAEQHRAVFDQLRERGIGVNLHYIPVHLQPYYEALGFSSGDFPQAEKYYSEAISIPLYHAMTDAQQDEVSRVLHEVLA